jgi:hypothetical protein
MLVWTGSLLAASAPIPDAKNFSGVMLLHEEKLTVQVTGVSLRQVLAEFEKLSGTRVRWLTQSTDMQISVTFFALPLTEALPRLLGEHSFLLFYSSTQEGVKPSQLWISARAQSAEHTNGRFSPSSDAPLAPAVLSDAPPSTEEPLDALLQETLNEQNPLARLDTLTHLGGYAQEDPRAHTILSHVARNDLDPQVKAAAEEILQNLE